MTVRRLLLAGAAGLGFVALAWMATGGDPMRFVLRQALPTDYFEREVALPDGWYPVAERLYGFKHGFNRALIVDSGEGLAVIDTFSPRLTAVLREELARRFPGVPVRWVFYSHHHLDHIRGAAALAPAEIVAHADLMRFVADFPEQARQVAPPTRTVEGDQVLQLGAVEMHMLFMPDSHSRTLYAFHFPAQRVVLAPDMAFVRSFPPFGLPDWYYPGYMRALDRIAALDFDTIVPSHAAPAPKAEFLAFRGMLADFREAAHTALMQCGGEATDGTLMQDIFDEVYPRLAARYGDWHGFHAMFVPHFFGQIGGEYLGY